MQSHKGKSQKMLQIGLYWPNEKRELEVSLVKEDLGIKCAHWEYRSSWFFSFVILNVCFTYSSFFPSSCRTVCVFWNVAQVQTALCFVAGLSLTIEEGRDTFYFFFPFLLNISNVFFLQVPYLERLFLLYCWQFGREYVGILLFSSLLPVWLSVLIII